VFLKTRYALRPPGEHSLPKGQYIFLWVFRSGCLKRMFTGKWRPSYLFHSCINSTYEMSNKSPRWLIMKISSMTCSFIFVNEDFDHEKELLILTQTFAMPE